MPGDDPRGPNPVFRRTTLIVAAVIAVTAVALAGMSWSGRGDTMAASEPKLGDLHQLNVNQAACLRFAIIIHRSDAEEVTLDLGRYQTLDPGAGRRIHDEVTELVKLARDFPAADDLLIRSFAATAQAGARVLARNGDVAFIDAAARRSQNIEASDAACRDLAGFDVETMEVR